jgi:hypothetical protein
LGGCGLQNQQMEGLARSALVLLQVSCNAVSGTGPAEHRRKHDNRGSREAMEFAVIKMPKKAFPEVSFTNDVIERAL